MEKQNSKAWWDERYKASENFLYSKEPSSFLMSQLHFLPEKATLLDVACGEGHHAVSLALKGFSVTAIDFSEVAVSRAQKLAEASGVKITLKNADLDFFIPELLKFDAIFCIDFVPPPTLRKSLIRGLKQQGHLFIEIPLTAAMKQNASLECFECMQPGELLKSFYNPTGGLQILYYSELNEPPIPKVFMVAKKTELF